jgi:hypothetical protein
LPGGGYIEFLDVEISQIFPAMYKYYDTHPIGSATVKNVGKYATSEIEIRFFLDQYMDDPPKLSARLDRLEPGEEILVDIYALFNENVLSIVESAKLSSEIRAEYMIGENEGYDTETLTLSTYDRNTMQWDDDRKIAAFVTAQDEEIRRTARNVASMVRDSGLAGFNREFQLAVAMMGMMEALNCAYVVDPSKSYGNSSNVDEIVVDSVQFPRQTLQYRAGDCDDLSTTFNALLESVGVETAFITVPGHIYSAFRLDMSSEQAGRTFSQAHDLIFLDDDTTWVPVETTSLRLGFLEAWRKGGQQWRKFDADGQAGFHRVRESWETYEPVDFSIYNYELAVPNREDVTYLFSDQIQLFVNQEIANRKRPLIARMERSPDDPRILNSLGILYARFGQNSDAEKYFLEAISETEYSPALLNLGNMNYLAEDFSKAQSYYKRVEKLRPGHPNALLGLARCSHAEEDYDESSRYYNDLKSKNPQLATKYAYLGPMNDTQERAAFTELVGETMDWVESDN